MREKMKNSDEQNVYNNEESNTEEINNEGNSDEENNSEENNNDESNSDESNSDKNNSDENNSDESNNDENDSKESNNEESNSEEKSDEGNNEKNKNKNSNTLDGKGKAKAIAGGVVIIGILAAIAILAAVAITFFVLRGSRSLSNDYVIIHQYRGLEITQMELTEITDEHVENMIQHILHDNIEHIQITDRPAQMGDFVTIDFAGSVDGEYFEGGTAEGAQLHLGSMTFIGPQGDYDGFEEQIVGHSVGDNFDIQIQFPEPYHAPDLEGAVANFNITLHAITEHVIPELTDEWVREVSEESTTVEEYREEIRNQLAENDRLSIANRQKSEALMGMIEQTEVIEFPEDVVEEELAREVAAFRDMAAAEGIEFEVFLSQIYQIDEATFMSEMRRMAEESVKVRLALDLLIERRRLDVSEEAIATQIEEIATQNRMTVEELTGMVDDEQLEAMIRQLIVAEYLVGHAVEVEEPTMPGAMEMVQ